MLVVFIFMDRRLATWVITVMDVRLGIIMGLLFLFTTRGGGDSTKVAEMGKVVHPKLSGFKW